MLIGEARRLRDLVTRIFNWLGAAYIIIIISYTDMPLGAPVLPLL